MVTRTDKLAACHVKSTKETDARRTPKAFFRAVEDRFGERFDIDLAASKENRLCKLYFSKEASVLKNTWTGLGWCNPPYSETEKFVHRCWKNAKMGIGSSVMLLASRTDSPWFQKYAPRATGVIFIGGRLKFAGADSGAPFPSLLMVFHPGYEGRNTEFSFWHPSPFERGFDRK